jgi:hypothetical protein
MPGDVMRRAAVAVIGALALVLNTACSRDGDEPEAGDVGAAVSSAGSSSDVGSAARRARREQRAGFPPARDACELIPADELAALIGEPVRARREVLERPDESVCAYAPEGGWSVLYVTAYWRGGRMQWETRESARAAGESITGIGEAALYGGILPSLVLNGDVLLEFAMPLLPDERRNFPILAGLAVSRL